jgi:hypothetical protein
VYLFAVELCDGLDNNCDGTVDNGLTFVNYYVDADLDGYGVGAANNLCQNPGVGYSTIANDCDDNNSAVNPDAIEICDGFDNDCSAGIDNGLTFINYYLDLDNDGYGFGTAFNLCSNPGAGYSTVSNDCNNNNNIIYPGAAEICDGLDNDCDGSNDDGLLFVNYYTDGDGDGYGTDASIRV